MDSVFPHNYKAQIVPGTASRKKITFVPDLVACRNGALYVLITENGSERVVAFANGQNTIYGVFSATSREEVAVIAYGAGYIYNVSRGTFVQLPMHATEGPFQAPENNSLFFYDGTHIIEYGDGRICWTSDRISWDGIVIDEVKNGVIFGKAWSAPQQKMVPLVVDVGTGHMIEGPVL